MNPMPHPNTYKADAKRSGIRIVICLFIAAAAFLLLTKHWQHVWPYLPYLLLLACPLMHLFMHHGHGDHKAQVNTALPTESVAHEGHIGLP
jgi:hypothetical protein